MIHSKIIFIHHVLISLICSAGKINNHDEGKSEAEPRPALPLMGWFSHPHSLLLSCPFTVSLDGGVALQEAILPRILYLKIQLYLAAPYLASFFGPHLLVISSFPLLHPGPNILPDPDWSLTIHSSHCNQIKSSTQHGCPLLKVLQWMDPAASRIKSKFLTMTYVAL